MERPNEDNPNVMRRGDAPTPFTAAEIKDGCPAGRTTHLLIEATGQPAVVSVTRFVQVDDNGADQETRTTDQDDNVLGEVTRTRSSWKDLQGHASFPAVATTIAPDLITTPLGRLDCLRYTVAKESEVSTFWFAPALPGMPIRFTKEREGSTVMTATLIRNEMP